MPSQAKCQADIHTKQNREEVRAQNGTRNSWGIQGLDTENQDGYNNHEGYKAEIQKSRTDIAIYMSYIGRQRIKEAEGNQWWLITSEIQR